MYGSVTPLGRRLRRPLLYKLKRALVQWSSNIMLQMNYLPIRSAVAFDAMSLVRPAASIELSTTTGALVPRIGWSHRRARAVSTVAFARAQPHGVPTTTTRVRSLGTPIVHAGAIRWTRETGRGRWARAEIRLISDVSSLAASSFVSLDARRRW